MATKAVATKEEPQLPDLVPTRDDDFQIDAADIQPPRLKVASPTTGAAANGLVSVYSLFSEKGSEDQSPAELVGGKVYTPGTAPEPGDGLKVYVLKMYKTKAANVEDRRAEPPVEKRQGGELRRWQFTDPSAPPFARVQYNYLVYVPASPDATLPHNLLLANTSTATAKSMNTLLGERKQEGHPLYTQPFELWPEKREAKRDDGQVNRWAIFKARPVDADADEVQAAQKLYGIVASKGVTDLDQEDSAPVASGAPSI